MHYAQNTKHKTQKHMSLNWELPKHIHENESLRSYTFQGEKVMHPKLHCLIWLTMIIGQDFCGGIKKKDTAMKRLRFLRKLRFASEVGIQLSIGRGAFDKDPTTWAGTVFADAKAKHGDYRITEDDIKAYWGLSTNASTMSQAKWEKRMMKFLNDERV